MDVDKMGESLVKKKTFYKNVVVPTSYEDAKHIVGKNGRHLTRLCKDLNMHKIWYNKHRKLIHVWGEVELLKNAVVQIKRHINGAIKAFKLQRVEFHIPKKDHMVAGDIDDPDILSKISALIGYRGKNFKHITTETGVSYIWFNQQSKRIEIWGPPEECSKAILRLQILINEIKNNQNKSPDQKMKEVI